jgi:hypothetical protein
MSSRFDSDPEVERDHLVGGAVVGCQQTLRAHDLAYGPFPPPHQPPKLITILVRQRPPAESDLQRFFRVTPPTVYQMIVELERRGLITRVPGQPRTIQVTLRDDELPRLQPIRTTAAGY